MIVSTKKFNLLSTFVAAVVATVWGNNGVVVVDAQCADPVTAVVTATNCWATGDTACIAAGFNDTVKKIHNGVVVFDAADRTEPTAAFFLKLASWNFTYTHQSNAGENLASIRYIDTTTLTDGSEWGLEPSNEYPFNFSYTQWEHALVTVNDDCRIIVWDQTGDNKEQEHDVLDWFLVMCKVLDDATLTASGIDPARCPKEGDGDMTDMNGSTEDNGTSEEEPQPCPTDGASTYDGINNMFVLFLSLAIGHYVW